MTRDPGGFAVLIILWMLALLALIADRMIVVGRSEIRIADNLRTAAVAEAAADGAVFEGIYRLSLAGPGGWKIDGRARKVIIGQQQVTLLVEDESLKVNLNAASAPLLQALFQQIGMASTPARAAVQRIVAMRAQDSSAAAMPGGSFRTLGQLASIPGIDREVVARLASHLTLDDPGGVPPGLLDPVVAAAEREVPPLQVTQKPTDPRQKKPAASRIVTIRALVGPPGGPLFERDAIIRLTGDQGYHILSWRADRDV